MGFDGAVSGGIKSTKEQNVIVVITIVIKIGNSGGESVTLFGDLSVDG